MKLKYFSFGATSAILTSMALIIGLGAVSNTKLSLITGLLIIAVADNISDTLGLHIHEESSPGEAEPRNISISNYISRLVISLTFVAIVVLSTPPLTQFLAILWGVALVILLTYLIAREQNLNPVHEIVRHLGITALVLLASQILGYLIHRFL
jgi:VIT1/CCC1 family predicted Fe2+/Mn2+ transporter